MNRRMFLKGSTAALGVSLLGESPGLALGGGKSANDRIQVAVVGVAGRGNNLLKILSKLDDVNVRYVCDVDESVRSKRLGWVVKETRNRPVEMRRLLV